RTGIGVITGGADVGGLALAARRIARFALGDALRGIALALPGGEVAVVRAGIAIGVGALLEPRQADCSVPGEHLALAFQARLDARIARCAGASGISNADRQHSWPRARRQTGAAPTGTDAAGGRGITAATAVAGQAPVVDRAVVDVIAGGAVLRRADAH